MRVDWESMLAEPFGEAGILQLCADCAQITEGVMARCAVHLLLTDDETIRTLNRKHRQVDRATDVLSFPAIAYPVGRTARDCPKRLRAAYDPDVDACMLGDIVLSYEHARTQAAEYGHSVRRELCYLVVHGLFHLMGYDHMTADEQKEMRRMEEKALRTAGVTRDGNGVQTADDQTLLALARQAMERSYSPYSRYRVGACLLSADGRLFQGCNIENASFGLSNCAERTALFKAVSEGVTEFTTIAIASERSAPWPCGACRQVLNEFAPGIRVLVTWGDGLVEEEPLSVLLPHGFGPRDVAES